jgi:glyoxylase-like metal-dependent hydrolase (beta-lactamase superfamily II)
MLIETFTVGSFQVNNYIIACEETRSAALIDAGEEGFNHIDDYIEANNLKLDYLLVTHGHLDHVAGANYLQKTKKIPVYINYEDNFLLDVLEGQLSMYGMSPSKPPKNTTPIKDGDTLQLGKIKIEVIATPGHSPGAVCYYMPEEKVIFTGDTVFADSVGRTDLPGGSYDQLIQSIKEKLLILPDDVTIYPGHGPATMLGKERQNNPFFGINARP